jgi:uncharacterized protein
MGYQASKIQMAYELPKILPVSDPNFQLYESFKARYGEDGNVIFVGIKTDKMFQLDVFNKWYDLNQEIKKIDGVKDVLSNVNAFNIVRNDSLRKFDFKPLITKVATTQADIDSVRATLGRLPFFKGIITSEDGQAHVMFVTFDQSKLNTTGRVKIANEIKSKAQAFGEATKLEVHLSGLPFIRTEFSAQVSREVVLFTILAAAVTALILLLFFRSWSIMFISMGVVLLGVVWSVGFIAFFEYKVSLLTGLIPSLIVVIGVPNSIFLTNKYHQEYARIGNKMQALAICIEKIGETTFWANVTTSVGFGVFYFTGSIMLVEFGLVAALSVMSTYAICLILITVIYSYLKPPAVKHTNRLDNKTVKSFLIFVEKLVHTRRSIIYGLVTALVLISGYGISKIEAVGYIVDDLPQDHPIYSNLRFFESNFKGVLPFEVAIDTGRPGRVLNPQTLTKIKVLQKEFAKYPEFTKPLSLVEALKFTYQAYRGGDPKYYVLPGALELNKLADYAGSVKGNENKFKGFLDSTRRHTRVSFQIADVGTKRIDELCNKLQPKIDSIFNYDQSTGQWADKDECYDARITGNSVVFTKGNDYLLTNLVESTLLAIILISIIMVVLFGDWRMILIAVVPSLVPLLITAGLMGFFDIRLKPSTTLIFSIAFGLSSDGTIYFLTKFKEESRKIGMTIADAISNTIRLTGISMFYTAIILFAGFAIFTVSTFRGTVSLGILISITLLMGMLSNLVLLPAFLLWVNKTKK